MTFTDVLNTAREVDDAIYRHVKAMAMNNNHILEDFDRSSRVTSIYDSFINTFYIEDYFNISTVKRLKERLT